MFEYWFSQFWASLFWKFARLVLKHSILYTELLTQNVLFRFEIAIFVLIFLNMVSMGIEHYNQSRVITFTLEICNALFTTIFSLGKRHFFRQINWCQFPFNFSRLFRMSGEDYRFEVPILYGWLEHFRFCSGDCEYCWNRHGGYHARFSSVADST